MNRATIESWGLNPNYIADQAKAILHEARKKLIDLNYIMEKTQAIEGFIRDLSELNAEPSEMRETEEVR